MNKFEQPKGPEQMEIPQEIRDYFEICKKMDEQKGEGIELHLLKLQELAESLYKNDEAFKKIADEEMKGVTDPEFDHDGTEENTKDRLQAFLDALSKYSQEFESKE